MHKGSAVLLVGLLMVGCSQATRTPAPEPSPASCQGAPVAQSPVLAGVQAFGLEGSQFWIPGHGIKVNWVEHDLRSAQMKVRLQRPGTSSTAYTAEFEPGPSVVGFPAAGCWEVTVEWQGQSGSTRVFMESASLAGVATGDEAATWADEGAAQELLKAAAKPEGEGVPPDRAGARLGLVWSYSGGRVSTPMLYLPAGPGTPPMVVVGKNLVTGDCRDADKPVAARISSGLAKKLEQNLGSKWKLEQHPHNPWLDLGGSCQHFSPA